MIGIIPTRISCRMIEESESFVINLPGMDFYDKYEYLNRRSEQDESELNEMGLRYRDAIYVNAPILTDCPVNIECHVMESMTPGTHRLFFGKVEAVHVSDEKYVDRTGRINWKRLHLL